MNSGATKTKITWRSLQHGNGYWAAYRAGMSFAFASAEFCGLNKSGVPVWKLTVGATVSHHASLAACKKAAATATYSR